MAEGIKIFQNAHKFFIGKASKRFSVSQQAQILVPKTEQEKPSRLSRDHWVFP